MPTTEQLRKKLLSKLKELFQLNQPDLDFGFYRIMHVKAEQVNRFIENDLLNIIREAFSQLDTEKEQKLKAEIEIAIQTAIEFGAPDPEETAKVKEAQARYREALNTTGLEGEIYDHLYRFFERYYDDGDFISRRYYTGETQSKAAPYAIPYNGEEVKLHWANADQYYIKTAEHFNNFTLDLAQAVRETRSKQSIVQLLDFDAAVIPDNLKVHFQVVDAAEGEHNNVKENDKRFFIIHQDKPVEINDAGELVLNFEYRPDPDKSKQEKIWCDVRNKEAVATILSSLKNNPACETYLNLLSFPVPTENDKNRTLLAKYINKYTSRNTMDYFIHKDLSGFLKRELDFYIKNEIMRLDDIEYADAPSVESYLSKIKILRKIAGKLIDFLSQLENFQKKLWLKKKFVTETNYCLTLDRIPEELYPEIAANREQQKEWIKLFAIDEIEGDAFSPSYTDALTINFLKANDKLVLDTRFFDQDFKDRMIASIHNFDEQCDGLLIHSENFQALKLLQERYREGIKCVYIDPPYNTGEEGFIYKDNYPHSSWLSFMNDRISQAYLLQNTNSSIYISINEEELFNLSKLLEQIFGSSNYMTTITVKVRHENRILKGDKDFHEVYESMLAFRKGHNHKPIKRVEDNTSIDEYIWDITINNPPEKTQKMGNKMVEFYGPNCYRIDKITPNLKALKKISVRGTIREGNSSGRFYVAYIENIASKYAGYLFKVPDMGKDLYSYRYFLTPSSESKRINGDYFQGIPIDKQDVKYVPYPNLWDYEKEFNNCKDEGGIPFRNGKKPVSFIKQILLLSGIKLDDSSIVLDYFSGSGSTAHTVIDFNREDDGKRKYILVEMGDYFDTVLKPRIAKVVYSTDWKEGKPKNRSTGISHCFKYIRLESYEDTLNNLRFIADPVRDTVLESKPSLKEDYMLHYLLDVETKGSNSLLNINSFVSPDLYKLKIKKPGSEEHIEQTVDLIETFNYLLGLRIENIAKAQSFSAGFTRVPDPEVPANQETKLIINGDLKQDNNGQWIIRKVEGWVPRNRYTPNDGLQDKVLIVWRNLTGNLEEDNLVLDAWFQKNRISTRDWEFDTIYVNCTNNLPNLRKEGDNWKVILVEEEFHKRMWEQEER